MDSSLKKVLGRSRITYALKVALAVFISYMIGKKISELFSELDPIIGGLWSVISAIFVLEEGHIETYKAAFLRILGTFIGSLTSGIFLFVIGQSLWTLVSCIFCTILICSILKLYEFIKIANIAVAVIIIVSQIQNPADIWLFCLSRFLDAVIGIVVAIVILHVFAFKKHRKDPIA